MQIDQYAPCDFYQNRDLHPTEPKFSAFFDEETASYYFALLDSEGVVLLKSESYPNAKVRENGIKAVLKNIGNAKRYAIKQDQDGFYVSLKAGNHQEIARSCGYLDATAANEALQRCLSQSEEAGLIPAPVQVLESVETEVAAEVIGQQTTIEPQNTDLPNIEEPSDDSFIGHELWINEIGQQTGYARFSLADSAHYFVVYNPDGSIYLRSKTFLTENERDATMSEVMAYINTPSAYKIKEQASGFAYSLVNDAGQELAYSVVFQTFTAAFVNTPAGRQQQTVVGHY